MGNKQPRSNEEDKPDTINEKLEDNDDVFYLEDWEIVNDSKNLKTKTSNTIKISNNILINRLKTDPMSEYTKIKELGSGTFAKVLLVKHNITGVIRAMKVIKKKISRKTQQTNESEVINEVGVLMKMDHPNIIKIFEFYHNKDCYYLITEYCGGGELFDKIAKSKTLLSEIQSAYIMYQILSAISYCHKMKIIHRDLKPENVLIKQDEKGFYRVKICDFGTSQVFKFGDIQTKLVGSAYYIAPEVITKKYNSKCDLWSCGVIMFVLLTRKAPFGGRNDKQILENVLHGQYKKELLEEYSPYAIDLISKLLERDISKRLNAEMALQHRWFQVYKCKEILNDIQDKDKIKKFIENLKNYHCGSIIQETALAFLVHNYPDLDEIVNACKLFSRIDKKGNGRINSEELYNGLNEIIKRPNLKDDTNKIFENLDVNQTNYIDYEQFVRAAIDKSVFLTEDALKLSFNFFDKEEKGEITFDSIAKIFGDSIKDKCNVDEELRKVIKEVSKGDEEKIDYQLFCDLMRNVLK